MSIDEDRLRVCLEVLEAARALPADDPRVRELEQASAHLRKSAKKARQRERAARARADDRAQVAQVSQQQLPEHASSPGPPGPETQPGRLHNERRCYVCKQGYRELHHHYHMLCPGCAADNWAAREQRADVRGRRALVTGGRVKIGFELVCKLLRDGAEVVVVTRFPHDAAGRFAALDDHAALAERLSIIGLDLRYLPGVVELCDRLLDDGRALDILVNNAAQTVWRPPGWYRELAEREPPAPTRAAIGANTSSTSGSSLIHAAALDGARAVLGHDPREQTFLQQFHASCRAGDQSLFPIGARDEEGKQLDLRARNSWVLGLEQVDARELVEAQLVNAIAPALLCSRLRPLLERSRFDDRHVVNVSAVEGQFAYDNKTPRHPHTNMAKAALNMLTRTCADDWAKARIYINSVDTGWISQENPEPIKQRMAALGFVTPLDVVDGAARVYDPIVRGVEGRPIWGAFLKDYRPANW